MNDTAVIQGSIKESAELGMARSSARNQNKAERRGAN